MTATPYYQSDFPQDEFAARRERVYNAIGGEAVAVLAGAPATGAFDLFRQTNEFFYLTGVEVPHAYVLLDGRERRTTLFLPPHDPRHERSEGAQLHADDAATTRRVTGIDAVAPHAALKPLLAMARTIFTPCQPGEGRQACRDVLRHAAHQRAADPWDRRPSAEEHFAAQIAAANPAAELLDLSPILDELRLIKSPRELAVMRRAGRLTAEAAVAAIRSTRAGAYEFQLAAAADYVFAVNGARGSGYRPIVASGPNVWNAHYFRNNRRLEDGDLVLFDYAPDVACYTSDIGRMWPVGGTYSSTQRELYGFVVEYHRALLRVIRPGRTVAELAAEAAELIRPRWTNWPFSQPAYRAAAEKMIHSEVAFTHPVGMAVHDVGDYRREPLRPGVVFALDPQLWVEEEQLYIRVEDTVAVSETGVESLTADAPLDLDMVAELVGAGSLLSQFPPLAVK